MWESSAGSESDGAAVNHNTKLDLSYQQLSDSLANAQLGSYQHSHRTTALLLQYNMLTINPTNIYRFTHIQHLDISCNNLVTITNDILQLPKLTVFNARNNQLSLSSLPKDFGSLSNIREINFSGNRFEKFPPQLLELAQLKYLYFGGNHLKELPRQIRQLQRLQVLYFGGNELTEIPYEVGELKSLQVLVICDNNLLSLPTSIAELRNLQTLQLHRNKLTTLPPQIVELEGLIELSLRDNPLVARFVETITFNPPSLKECAARTIKVQKITYTTDDVPYSLIHYLNTAQHCVNPRCEGVYFEAKVKHIKFVDFCGKYRIPLQQYLCSPSCTSHPLYEASGGYDVAVSRLQKVLLG